MFQYLIKRVFAAVIVIMAMLFLVMLILDVIP
jgi:lipopolysaccharide export LptBFGC system permease protein LptF